MLFHKPVSLFKCILKIRGFLDEENQDINTEFGGTLKNLLESKWIQNIIELYTKIETLVAIGKVLSIGVGDLHLKPLKAIYENVKIKPCLDHFNIEGCCVVNFSTVIFYY